jgi:acetylornithine deacetylase/succinyl-diaminopimelate desuccinylase-like protein
MLRDISIDPINNVYARLPGKSAANPLLVSAHLDTVFASTTGLEFSLEAGRIYGPGIGDNALGVAALFGLLWLLREANVELAHDLWFAANVCEEGLGNLRGMKAVVDRFGASARAYLVVEGTALGMVYHRAVGVRRYRVIARTAGGHSWSDYGQPSAVHELARLVTQITSLQIPASPRTTLNVGVISGGTGVNVLASEAQFELDLRSESVEAMNGTAGQVEEMIRSSRKEGVAMEIQVIGERPSGEIPTDHPLAQLAARCLSEQGLKAKFMSGSTDANVPLSRGFPAVVLGITTGAGAHTVHEYVDIAPMEKGMRQVFRFVETVLTEP